MKEFANVPLVGQTHPVGACDENLKGLPIREICAICGSLSRIYTIYMEIPPSLPPMGRPRKPIDATADAKAVRARLKDKDLEGWQRQRLQAAQLGLAKALSLPRKPKGGGPAGWLDPETAAQFKAELGELGGTDGRDQRGAGSILDHPGKSPHADWRRLAARYRKRFVSERSSSVNI